MIIFFYHAGDRKKVAMVPCTTDEQISLVKTTQVSAHASASKGGGGKCREGEDGSDCFKNVLY